MKLLPMMTDPSGGWPLRSDVRPSPPSPPGSSVRVEAAMQSAPRAFTGLRVGPDHRLQTDGPAGLKQFGSSAGVWRVDEVTIDDAIASDVIAALEAEALSRDDHDQGLLIVHGSFGVGSRVSIRATNVGENAAYFYATWELEDVQ